MPAIKKRTSPEFKYRDYWGDEKEGKRLSKTLDLKFGTKFGARKIALEYLGVDRRILTMYLSGERNIPEKIWLDLADVPNLRISATQNKNLGRRVTRVAPKVTLDEDDIDPLS